MKRTTKSIFALIIVLVMCVSFCVPTFAEVALAAETDTTANCPLTGKTHTLEALAAGGHITIEKDAKGVVTLVDGKGVVAVYEVENPNCEDRGYTIYECLACAKDGKDVKFVDSWVEPGEGKHEWGEITPIKEATCTENGVGSGECKICGFKSNTIVIPKLGHSYGEPKFVLESDPTKVVEDYTCGMEGVIRIEYCPVCDTYEEVEIKNKKHDWNISFEGVVGDQQLKKPTCVEKGLAFYDCKNCSVEGVKEVPVLSKDDPAAHTWECAEKDYKAPTCGADGWYKNATCELCGATADEVKIPATGAHDWVDATCESAKTCKVCGLVDEKSPALDHNFKAEKDKTFVPAANMVNVKITESVSCKEPFYFCANTACSNKVASKTAGECEKCKQALTYDDGGIGHVTFDCTLCEKTGIEKELPAKSHPAFEETYEAPTCEKWGFEAKACLACGDYEYFIMLPPYSHVPGEGNYQNNWGPVDDKGNYTEDSLVQLKDKYVAATCDADGVDVWYCNVCQTEVEIVLEKFTHDWKEISVDATCAFPAHKVTKCQRENCGTVKLDANENDDEYGRYEIGTELDPNNHAQLATEWTTIPTCDKVGYEKTFCKACNWVERDAEGNEIWSEVPAFGHDATAWNEYYGTELKGGHWVKEVTAANCTDRAVWEWACDLCDKKENKARPGDEYAPLGHEFYEYDDEGRLVILGTLVKVVDATCLEAGYTEILCARCGVSNVADRVYADDDKAETVWDSSDELLTYMSGDAKTEDYKHDFKNDPNSDEYGYKAPQCTVDGYKFAQREWICEDCGASEWRDDKTIAFDIKDVTHHSTPVLDPDAYHRDPTCTITGIEHYKCTTCGRTCSNTLPATQHEKGDVPVIIPAVPRTDCTKGGSPEYYVCVKCGENVINYPADCDTAAEKAAYEAKFAKLEKHDFADATCTAPKTCKNDGCTATEGKALGHDWVNATCTEDKHCARCDAKEEGTKLNHMKNGVSAMITPVVVPVTCVADGYTYTYCSICNGNWSIYDYKYATGHSFEDDDRLDVLKDKNVDLSQDPTCTTDGWIVYNCQDCDVHSDKIALDKLAEDGLHTDAEGNRFDDYCVDKDGKKYPSYVCVTPGCGHDDFDVIHNYNTDEKGNPIPYEVGGDCTEKNYALYICLDCREHYLDEDLDDDGVKDEPYEKHNFVSEIVKAATLTEKGIKKYTCTHPMCEVSYTEEYEHGAAVQFDFKITNLVGEIEKDGYAGRIKLVVDMTAKDVSANNAILNINFNNELLSFVGGNLLSSDFTYYDSFTTPDAANAKGYVVVTAASADDVKLTTGAFAELYFDVRVDTLTDIVGKTAVFSINETTTDGSAPTAVTNKANTEITELYGTMPTVTITRLGDLTLKAEDDKVDGLDASALLDLIKARFDADASYVYRSEADLDRNGVIDVEDYIIMAQLNNGSVSYADIYEEFPAELAK